MTVVGGAVALMSLTGCAGSSTRARQEVHTSAAVINTVADLTRTSQLVFTGEIVASKGVSNIPSASPPGESSPQYFKYDLFTVHVDKVLASSPAAGSLGAGLAGTDTVAGFARLDDAVVASVSNPAELREAFRTAAEVPKAGSRGIFFVTFHDLGEIGKGFEIVGFASYTTADATQAKFEPGLNGALAGSVVAASTVSSVRAAELSTLPLPTDPVGGGASGVQPPGTGSVPTTNLPPPAK